MDARSVVHATVLNNHHTASRYGFCPRVQAAESAHRDLAQNMLDGEPHRSRRIRR